MMNNRQAIGYMLSACKTAGISRETAEKLFEEMYRQFDEKTEEEAQEAGFKWYQENE